MLQPSQLSFAPDCGLSQTARWAARQKLVNMVAGCGHRAQGTGTRVIRPVQSHAALLADIRAAERARLAVSGSGGWGKVGSCCNGRASMFCSIPIFQIRSRENTARPTSRMCG